MQQSFDSYVAFGKSLIAQRPNINWDLTYSDGDVNYFCWNLSKFTEDAFKPEIKLTNLKLDSRTFNYLLERGILNFSQKDDDIGHEWIDLVKAATAVYLFSKRINPSAIVNGVIRPLKVIATVCHAKSIKPFELTAIQIEEAITVADQIQPSKQLSNILTGLAKNLFDANHISIATPIYPTLTSKFNNPNQGSRKSKITKSAEDLAKELKERKDSEKLPERKAFWELVRIVFSEKPQSFTDALRFGAIKVLILTGLRIGEVVKLPADWKVEKNYFDHNGVAAGELGGISRSLQLRHFAEKQEERNSDSVALIEGFQHIPKIFESIIEETLDELVKITAPLRATLKNQIKTKRLLPWYKADSLVPAKDIYTHLSGNPFWLRMDEEVINKYISEYKTNFSPDVLHEISEYQEHQYHYETKQTLDMAMYVYFNRILKNEKLKKPLNFRDARGNPWIEDRMSWRDIFLKVCDVEEYIRNELPTKMPDTSPIKLINNTLQPYELLFLNTKRSLAEERNQGINDITKSYSVGIPDEVLLTSFLTGSNKSGETIFQKYGESDEDKELTLHPHSLRHLQNTELFRLGIADTIISKRFNRKSVEQSYVYDHRSLSEQLDSVDLPDGIEAMLGPKASSVAKLINIGRASGPVVDEFKRIQKEEGDEAAFNFLRLEADGFHPTPYGHCINSFTVDPCPKHLECFNNCKHLTATNLDYQIKNLTILEKKFVTVIEDIKSNPTNYIGKHNQLKHATIRLEGVRKILKTKIGDQVFPDGVDLSKDSGGILD